MKLKCKKKDFSFNSHIKKNKEKKKEKKHGNSTNDGIIYTID